MSHTYASSAELLILSAIERRARHGYDIAQWIRRESDGAVTFHAASLYPLLYRLERRGWIRGAWVTADGGPRKRVYQLTRDGQARLAAARSRWRAFARAVSRLAGVGDAPRSAPTRSRPRSRPISRPSTRPPSPPARRRPMPRRPRCASSPHRIRWRRRSPPPNAPLCLRPFEDNTACDAH